LALASSLPNIKGLRRIDFFYITTSNPSVVPAMLEGFRNNTSLHEVNIAGRDWSQELSFLLYRNKCSHLLEVSESLGLWSRALDIAEMRPDVLFHVLTSQTGVIRILTPGEDSSKRKRNDSE
jgi:hypothetical protein